MPESNATIINHLVDIKRELATNTAVTVELKDQLRTLNGKVAAHESRLQSLESDKAVNNRMDELNEKRTENNSSIWRRWTDKMLWGGTALLALILYRVLVETGIIKDIIK